MSVEVERAELLQEVRRRRPCLLRVTPRASARHGGRTPGMAEDEPDAGIASEDAIADGQVRSSCRVEQEFSRKRRDARHRGAGKCGWVDEYTLIAYSGPKTQHVEGWYGPSAGTGTGARPSLSGGAVGAVSEHPGELAQVVQALAWPPGQYQQAGVVLGELSCLRGTPLCPFFCGG